MTDGRSPVDIRLSMQANKPRAESENAGWRNAGFRGYADHMATPEFAAGLDALRALASQGPAAPPATRRHFTTAAIVRTARANSPAGGRRLTTRCAPPGKSKK